VTILLFISLEAGEKNRCKTILPHEMPDWFDGLTITTGRDGETIPTGPIVDQTALHGVLIKIRDLGLPLLSVARLEPEQGE
jgi:hypothetical protein